jgi:pimeloyl-ACP methyl ester carboxylesterase
MHRLKDGDMLETEELRAYLVEVAAVAGLELTTFQLPRDQYVEANGLRLHYLDWGDPAARPLILLHGGALTAHTWDLVCLGLQPEYRCIAPDLRGHGDTEWAPDGDYSTDAYRRDLEALLAHLGIDRCVLIGNSLGGMTAARYTAERGSSQQPPALVLVDVGPEMRDAGRQRLRAFTGGPRELDSVEDFVDRAMAFNPQRRRETLRRSLLNNLRQLPSGKWTWKYDPNRFGRGPGPASRPTVADRWNDIQRITCPTLVVRGGRSDMFHDADAEKLAASLHDGRWVRIENASHTVQSDQPVALVKAVREFLASLGQDGPAAGKDE